MNSTLPAWLSQFVLPLMPTVLTIIGWVIVGKREENKRKTDRFHARIDAAIELSQELKKLAIRYYQEDESLSVELGQEIVFTQKKLSDLCNKLEQGGEIQNRFNELKIEITGGNFQSKQRQRLEPNHQKFLMIRNKAFDLRKSLDDLHDK